MALELKNKLNMLFGNISKFFSSDKTRKIFDIVLKVLSILLFISFAYQLYTKYALDYKQVLPDSDYLLILFLRTLTTGAVGIGILIPWFKPKNSTIVFAAFAIIIPILNFVFFENNMIAWGKGREDIYSSANGWAYEPVRVYFFIAEQIILLIMGVYYIARILNRKEYKNLSFFRICVTAIVIPLVFASPAFVQDLNLITAFTKSKHAAMDFNTEHILFLLSNAVVFAAMFIPLRKADENSKRFALCVVALAAVFNFFYVGLFGDGMKIDLGALPFHLCNAATVLIFCAFAFKREELFYFNLFVNVLGCVFAMLMPNYDKSDYWWTYSNFRFWFNHVTSFILPIIALSLGVFNRPKFKSMLKAIGIFACYFLIVAVLNAWFSNYGSVNYFFINDNFFFDKIGGLGTGLKDNFVWEFYIGKLNFRFYPLFHALVFVVFVVLMFVVWYVYDFFFNVADSHKAIHYKKLLAKEWNIEFKKQLNGRSIHEPLVLEDVGMIEIKNFTKVYSGSKQASVEDLNLTIKDGEVYGFLGHNGAGKSTTIKSLVGIQSITSGQMIVDGFDVAKQPVEAKLRIGYVSDNHAVYERLTGREYINYIADLYMVPQKERDERIEKYTKMFKLEDAIDREIKSYSHGMKQKIVVISSLIHDPKVWILDEPLTGLDPTSAFQIKECMREHASRGNIVFFSSHVIEVVEKICTRICIIGHGKLQCEYSLAELKEKGISLESLYLKYVSSEERIH